jgi:predicted TIM-barrel fold metal-dependent hydrolase
MPVAMDVVDFHGHWFPPALVASRPPAASPAMAAAWPLLRDLDAQLEAAERTGIAVKVVCAPLSSIEAAATSAGPELAARVNDAYAAAVAEHGGRLAALAAVDAFAGDAGAEEARRAVDELGLPGLAVDCARGERLLSDPEARPALAFAAERGIPVFAHPVTPRILGRRFQRPGAAGVLLARGTESAASTLALAAGGTLAELPGLRLVIAGIGAAALLLGAFADGAAELRERLHVDTMGFDPRVTRFLVDVVGAERVLTGSDWPIMRRDAGADRVRAMLDDAGLDARDAALVAGANARRLLGLAQIRA